MKKNSTGLERKSSGNARRIRVPRNQTPEITIGVDLGDRSSRYCALDGQGTVLFQRSIPTTQRGLAQAFASLAPCRIALEVGTHSPWVIRLLHSWGHEVIVANARQVHPAACLPASPTLRKKRAVYPV